MKLLIVLISLVIAVSAAPQGANLNTQDTEFIPSGIPRRSSSGGGDTLPTFPGGIDFHFIPISRGNIPQSGPNIFDILFGSGSTTDGDNTSPSDSGLRSFFDGFFGGGSSFPSIFDRPSNPDGPGFPFNIPLDIPDFSDIPDGTDNSTHEVKVINGTRFEVNRTITKDEDGGFTFTQVFLNLSPHKDDSPTEGGDPKSVPEEAPPKVPAEVFVEPAVGSTLGEADPATNQMVSSSPLTRRRRWLNWFKSFRLPTLKKNVLPISSEDNSIENLIDETEGSIVHLKPAPARQPLVEGNTFNSLDGDTDVNYLDPRPRVNPDAEVFDVELLMDNAERFASRDPRPLMSESLISRPRRFQVMRSQPMKSQPMVSHSEKSQTIQEYRKFPQLI